MCVGKSLTGGYMTLAATLCTREISDTISLNPPHAFMHGPTFMANPLACRVAQASIELLLSRDWAGMVRHIEQQLVQGLAVCRELDDVADVRILGAIGVIELEQAVNMPRIQQAFVDAGCWVRPFGKLVYLMPPYVIDDHSLQHLMNTMHDILKHGKHR
jgi:adenosylmethionine-8-amino-7-oxononanoate aminotransferase